MSADDHDDMAPARRRDTASNITHLQTLLRGSGVRLRSRQTDRERKIIGRAILVFLITTTTATQQPAIGWALFADSSDRAWRLLSGESRAPGMAEELVVTARS